MQVRVAFFGMVRETVPSHELEVKLDVCGTVEELLGRLTEQYGPAFGRAVRQGDGQIWPSVAVLVNGQNITLMSGLETGLAHGDNVVILPVILGG